MYLTIELERKTPEIFALRIAEISVRDHILWDRILSSTLILPRYKKCNPKSATCNSSLYTSEVIKSYSALRAQELVLFSLFRAMTNLKKLLQHWEKKRKGEKKQDRSSERGKSCTASFLCFSCNSYTGYSSSVHACSSLGQSNKFSRPGSKLAPWTLAIGLNSKGRESSSCFICRVVVTVHVCALI